MTSEHDGIATAAASFDLPNIALPVFVRVDIDGYELFPGRNNDGLHHVFAPGVTVIAGINGLGKTTLLNVLLRVLLGPFNPEKVTPFEVGAKSHDLVRWKQARRFFSARVSDEAVIAKARAEVQIGRHTLIIERQLRDLGITFLEFNGEELECTEDEFVRVTLEASNAASRYDFDFLVRYLVFFLEQRVPLFWNERGQIETFRILLCDSALSTAFHQKQDELQTKDSLYRNLGWQARKRSNALRDQREAYAGSDSISAKAGALQEAFQAQSKKNRSLSEKMDELSQERSSIQTKILLAKIELEEARRAYEGLQQNFLATLFPSTDASARYVFSTLLSDNGCAVCGNKSDAGYKRLEHLLSHGKCPACESNPEDQDRHVGLEPVDQGVLDEAAQKVTNLQTTASALEGRESALHSQLRDLSSGLRESLHLLQLQGIELDQLKAQLPPTPDELKHLEQQVADDAADMSERRDELERLYIEYEELVAQVSQRVSLVADRVRSHFSHFAKSFMAENCQLGLSTYKEKVGELKQFVYPCFNVYMTSATSPDRETVRSHDEDVSESQREFIDLAFRMALIAAVASPESRSMLVIETPEASLDAFFVDQAGELLRQFGNGSDDQGNVVIVSSNLARQNMIGALLGFSGLDEAAWPDSSSVDRHLVNMLDECKPNAALRNNRALYENALKEATKSRLSRRGS